jgi:hypothetical protein
MKHLDKAKSLVGGDYDSLRYAVLELRYAIECLVYRLVPSYEKELSDETRDAWRPAEILQEMVRCNPDLPRTASYRMGLETENGEPGRAVDLGTQTGITPKALQEDYARLGSFLHAKQPDGRPHDEEKLRRSVEQVIGSLERYRGDSIIANFSEHQSFACESCGREIVRRISALAVDPLVRCTNKECRAVYERITGNDGGRFKMVQEDVNCPACVAHGYFDRHNLNPGMRIKCRVCSREFITALSVLPSDPAKSP